MADSATSTPKSGNDNLQSPQGWALKTSQSRKRFTDTQKQYLMKKFNIGQATGRKVDPASVSRDMRRAKDCNSRRLFSVDEFLTTQQIASFFSRQAKNIAGVEAGTDRDEEDFEDDDMNACSAREEEAFDEIRSLAMKEIDLYHPIVYDTYDVCNLVSAGILSKNLSVSVLEDMCAYFDLQIDTDKSKMKLKKPYADKLIELVKSCSCGGKGDI